MADNTTQIQGNSQTPDNSPDNSPDKTLKKMTLKIPDSLNTFNDNIESIIKHNETIILEFVKNKIFECEIGDKLCAEMQEVFDEVSNELRKLY